MALTVYAEDMGLFHEGSGGKGIAPLDVCLSPPPPPTGPIPIPYVNVLQASNLAKGSKTVKVDGKPTALEDTSYVRTSTGDEMGTQGGSVITAKTKGKGYFKLWSFTVQIEGKGVCRHGDPMGQNCASDPPSCVNMAAVTEFKKVLGRRSDKPCKTAYKRKSRYGPTEAQKKAVKGKRLKCWECKKKVGSIADHQPPLNVAWAMGGCHLPADEFKKWATSVDAVVPHCKGCSSRQGGTVKGTTKEKVDTWLESGGAGRNRDKVQWDEKKLRNLSQKLSQKWKAPK
jgi:uncharacterized Zn-binding protein involved in type VI secretion